MEVELFTVLRRSLGDHIPRSGKIKPVFPIAALVNHLASCKRLLIIGFLEN